MIIVPTSNGHSTRVSTDDISGFPYGSILITSGLEIDYLKAEKKNEVKFKASEKILDIIPEWKQRNITARCIEIVDRKVDSIATPEEVAELDSYRAFMQTVTRPIRAASDSIEAEIDALTTEADVKAYNVRTNPLWP